MGGRPKLLPEAEGLPRLDRDSYNRLLNKTLAYSKDELQEIIRDTKRPMIEVWLASIVAKGTVNGDTSRLEALLSRAIGAVKHEVLHSGHVQFDGPPQQLIQIAVQMSGNARKIE
jgi:hypothetical protein